MAIYPMTDAYYAQKQPLAPLSSLTPYERKLRLQGMQDWQNYTAVNPGAAIGGSGSTGLNPNDERGWELLQARQRQNLADENELAGKAAPTVRFGGYDDDPGFSPSSSDEEDQYARTGRGVAGLRAAQAARQSPANTVAITSSRVSPSDDAGSLSGMMAAQLAAQGRNPDQIASQLKEAGYLKPDKVTDEEDAAAYEKARRAARLPYEAEAEDSDVALRAGRAAEDLKGENLIRDARTFQNADVQRQFAADTLAKIAIAAAGRNQPAGAIAAGRMQNDPAYAKQVRDVAAKLLRGEMSPTQAQAQFGGMGGNAAQTKHDIGFAANELDPSFNWEEAEQNYQQGKTSQGAARLIDNLTASSDIYKSDLSKLPGYMSTGSPLVNSITQMFGRYVTGNPDLAKVDTDQTLIGDELAKIMAGGSATGGSATSDAKLRQGIETYNSARTPAARLAALQSINELLGQRREALTRGTFMQAPPMPPLGSTEDVPMIFPRSMFPDGKPRMVHPADIDKARQQGAVAQGRGAGGG